MAFANGEQTSSRFSVRPELVEEPSSFLFVGEETVEPFDKLRANGFDGEKPKQ
jgi:hypothetical protein